LLEARSKTKPVVNPFVIPYAHRGALASRIIELTPITRIPKRSEVFVGYML
jgi:hypothetical protein